MTFTSLLFYFFAAILLFSGFRVITAKNPVHAALFLVLSFFTASILWMLIQAEFLAISLVLVYVGAVMVLFLFVVMMLDINFDKLREGFWNYLPVAGLVGLVMATEMVLILVGKDAGLQSFGDLATHAPGYSNIRELGRLVYTNYLYPFELAAVVLLVAMIAAIALTMRHRKDTKSVDPADQVKVRRQDRIRLVSMAAEKPADYKNDADGV